MTPAAELIFRAKLIRERLRNPPNAVRDRGYQSPNKKSATPPPPKEKEKGVLEYHQRDEWLKARKNRIVNFSKIMSIVCQYYGVKEDDIYSDCRKQTLVVPRYIACYLALKHTGISFSDLGKALGKSDHSSVCHGVTRIRKRMESDESFRQSVEMLEEDILERSRSTPSVAPKHQPNLARQPKGEGPQ